jgi:hypothetical protein
MRMAVLGWPKTLAWKDFGVARATVPTSYQGTHTDCHIETDISFSFTVASPAVKGGDYQISSVKVVVKLNALKTWVLKGVSTASNQAQVLQHEQGHYNIAGITARDVEQALLGMSDSDQKQLRTDANAMAASIIASGQTEEDTYDGPVADSGCDHGNDIGQQAAWNSKIAAASSLADLP